MPRWGIRFPDDVAKDLRLEAAKRNPKISGNELVVLSCRRELKRSKPKKDPVKGLAELDIDFESLWKAYRLWLPKGKTSAKTVSASRLLTFAKKHKATHGELCDAFILYLQGVEEKFRREFQYCVTTNLDDALEQVRNPRRPPPAMNQVVETVEEELSRLNQWLEQYIDSDRTDPDDLDTAIGIRQRIKELEDL